MSMLIFFVNGKKVIEKCPDPEQTLLSYLRDNLRLCGTKLGCGEGGCGACTVMISKINRTTNEIIHLAVNACLTPMCSIHGTAITTVEGIGSTKTKLHPVQERIAKAHGTQCGFCTPGMVMSMYALLRSSPKPSMKDLETTLQGNLCRCTGYRPIIEGYKTFTSENCAMREKCCKNGGSDGCGPSDDANNLFEESEFTPYDSSQEPIFPPELKLSSNLDEESLTFKTARVTWFRPTSLKLLLEIKRDNPNIKIINGNTEVGVEVKFKYSHYPHLATPTLIPEMNNIQVLKTGINIGAAVTLIDMETKMKEQIKEIPEFESRMFKAIVDMLQYFAGKQIRNVASVGGNIMTGSPISDLNPIFMAAGIEMEVASAERGSRKINMGKEFFTGYRRNIIEPDEILISIFIPRTVKDQYFLAYKQAKRRDDDIAIVNAAINVFFNPGTDVIKQIDLSFGGMAPTTVLAPQTSNAVKGMKWNNEMLEILNKELIEELPLDPSAPGGMILYRRSLTLSLFFKAYLEISQRLEEKLIERIPISNNEKSGSKLFQTLNPKSSQFYEQVPKDQSYLDAIGRPEIHSAAFKQASGEAVYCDDLPNYENELYLAFVLSKKAHANLISIDPTEALKVPGVVQFFSANDLKPNQNKMGIAFQDEEIFVSKKVTSHGQVLGAIIANNQTIAQRAARLVKVEYEELSPVIISIEDAIKYNSFYPGYPIKIMKGDVEKAFKESDHVIKGECRLGGQEHFYLETQVALAIPNDSDELLLFCSTQDPSAMQKVAGKMLEIPSNKIVAKAKRLGGGFGGKEFKSALIALPVALAAYRIGRPVRCMLDRDEDMMMTAGRHPFLFKYKISCQNDGKITGCEIDIFNNAGYSMDLSFAVLERAILHFENVYMIPNVKCMGWVCKTNIPSNTAFRGFGSPQALLAAELMIRDVAKAVGKSYIEVAELNMYKKGDWTPCNTQIEDDNIRRCWDEVLRNSDYHEREIATAKFNEENRWRKRGISALTSKYGIAFGIPVLNQAGALVHIYTDGSVLISHGGTEMGQGLHTKMIQVASKVLEIPTDRIHISETSSDKVPNSSPTAASFSSDLNGMAIINACTILKERLAPICKEFADRDWNFWISKAYMNRISLSTTGYFTINEITYNLETNAGNPYLYYTYGAAVSEVEIDCLTGDHQVIRTDIVMDLGTSMNPAIDIGQIEGAFIQGYGLHTMEDMIYSSTGEILSKGPGTYKIPAFSDIPGEFNVSLLKGSSEPRAVFSSKAVGEPPLGLAASVFLAIKEAIGAARRDENLSSNFFLHSPATSARIRMACSDSITKNFKLPEKTTFIPWNVDA